MLTVNITAVIIHSSSLSIQGHTVHSIKSPPDYGLCVEQLCSITASVQLAS